MSKRDNHAASLYLDIWWYNDVNENTKERRQCRIIWSLLNTMSYGFAFLLQDIFSLMLLHVIIFFLIGVCGIT
jgi:hypothetical protein